MERENRDDTAGGGESETQPVISSVRDDKEDELEGSAAKTKSDSVNEPGEAEHPEQNDTTTGGESEIKSLPSTTKERVLPELTLVLIGDTNSIEVGSKNILLDHDEQTQQFSFSLYDLCGRHISVINMLGQQNTDKFPLNQGVHAFLLLLPNGLQNSHYSSGVQWLEKTFGKESLAYLMTVVTHGSDEECDRALTDLKANSSFVEKRYHTCTKSMRDEKEIIALLRKVDVMVSENDPHCYNGLTCGENKEHEEETPDSSVFHQNQTGLQSGFVTLPRLSRLDRQCQDGDAQKGSLPDGGGSIALKHSDSLTSFTVDLGPSLMTEVLSLIDNPSCLQMSNHSQAAGEEDERGDEEDEDDSSLSETPVQSPGVTSPSPSFSRSMNNRGRSCSSNWTEQEEDRRSLRTPDASAGSPQRAEPVMEAERFQRAADVLSRHYGGESFTKGTRVNNNTPSPAVSYSRKTSYAFSEEEEEIKV
ncbi:uncharacterized protein [Trachinotus anak]|uniref:uncharacterized protein isoform X4 n=1 Tax=Trachinotus anak TaxID=443729 RepID=UPI0039F1B8C3